MVRARLIRSDPWLHDRLLRDATPPSSYVWADRDEEPDISIFLTPLVHDRAAPERLHTLRPRDLSRLFIFSQADIPVPWAPGMFTSLSARQAGPEFAGGCYVIPGYFAEPGGVGDLLDRVAQPVDAPGGAAQPPDLLWSFFGSVRTHEALRTRIIALDDARCCARDSQAWHTVRWEVDGDRAHRRREAVAAYVRSVARAKFVVAPRGVGPSSMRLFEAMRAGRAPVVVSDDWLPPAFIDWDSCSIRIREAEIESLPMILREREPEAEGLGVRAREVWERRFAPSTMVHHIVETCIRIDEQNPRPHKRVRIAASGIARREALRRARAILRAP